MGRPTLQVSLRAETISKEQYHLPKTMRLLVSAIKVLKSGKESHVIHKYLLAN